MHVKSTGILLLSAPLLLLYACGGGGGSEEAEVTSTAKATEIPAAPPTEPTSEATSSSGARLEEIAQADAEQYGLAAACLVDGDITEGGYDLAEVAAIFAPFGLAFDPAIGTLEFVAGVEVNGQVVSPPQTIVSVYDPNYQGATVALRRVIEEGLTCYVPST